MWKIYVAAAAVLVLAGCAGPRPTPPAHREKEWHPAVEMLQRYAGKDGKLTRAEMEAGLRKDFAAADTNHDGILEPDEVLAVNEQRWAEAKSAYTPLVDFKGQGYVDFDEFAAAARSLFDELDRSGDGVLTPDELNPNGPPDKSGPQQQDQQQHGHGRHGRRGGGQGDDGGQGDGGQGNGGQGDDGQGTPNGGSPDGSFHGSFHATFGSHFP